MRGTYLLFLKCNGGRKEIGSLGEIEFCKGYYVYVGSAMNGIEARVGRHFKKEKRKRWHIDYFLEISAPLFYLAFPEKLEERVAKLLSERAKYVKGFGSTDSMAPSHLFYSPSLEELLSKSLEVIEIARQNRGDEKA